MNHGPLLFLGAFFALATSWLGLVLMPQIQIGGLSPDAAANLAKLETRTNWVARQHGLPVKESADVLYPAARPGLAAQGAEVYRANGCYYCHSQQVRQTGVAFDVVLVNAGTNATEALAALRRVRTDLNEAEAQKLRSEVPKTVLPNVTKAVADAAEKALKVGGAQATVQIVPLGPDIARGWGKRQSVAQDYLLDYPVMLGAQRVGPDLAGVASRLPDEQWQLRHLYNPKTEVKDSLMPPYRYLFVKRKIERQPSPDALKLPAEFAPPAGFEIVPTAEARALAAYLLSLRADEPLFEAQLALPPPVSTVATNAPASATATNGPPQ